MELFSVWCWKKLHYEKTIIMYIYGKWFSESNNRLHINVFQDIQ
jgi:hypothetical protein